MNRNGIIYSQIATVLGGDDDGEGTCMSGAKEGSQIMVVTVEYWRRSTIARSDPTLLCKDLWALIPKHFFL